MLKFEQFNESLLIESLDTVQQYYMTDDTKLPTQIYGRFDVKGKAYHIGLTETNTLGLYELDFGKAMAKYVMWWKYHRPQDILSALATIFSFTRYSIDLLGNRILGISIKMNVPLEMMKKISRIAERIMKKSFNKTFSFLNVEQPQDDDKNKYLFFIRKGKSPNKIFKSAKFKHYDLPSDVGSLASPIPAASLEDSVEKKKPLKKMVKIEPSTKYTFKGFDISNDEIGSEIFNDVIDNLRLVSKNTNESELQNQYEAYVTEKKKENEDNLEKANSEIINFKNEMNKNEIIHAYLSSLGEFSYSYFYNSSKEEVLEKMKKIEFYEKYLENPSPKKELESILDYIKKNIDEYEFSYKIWESNDVYNFTKVLERKMRILRNKNAPVSFDVFVLDKKDTLEKTNVDFSSLKPSLETYSDISYPSGDYANDWVVKNDRVNDIEEKIERELGYHDKVSNLKHFNVVRKYTGTEYLNYNSDMRNSFRKYFNDDIVYELDDNIKNLIETFDEIDPFPESLIVFRSTILSDGAKKEIKIGEEFVDPGFLSTSLKSLDFGDSVRMRIFIPKGSKIIPILSNSRHVNEKEIILPPFSILKIVEIKNSGRRMFLSCVYTGSARNSFLEKYKSKIDKPVNEVYYNNMVKKGNLFMIEKKNKPDDKRYDSKEKFSGEYDTKLGKKISDYIKKNDLKKDK